MGEWVWVAMGNRLNSELKYSGEWVQDTGDMTRRLKLEVTTDLFILCQNFQGVIFKKNRGKDSRNKGAGVGTKQRSCRSILFKQLF